MEDQLTKPVAPVQQGAGQALREQETALRAGLRQQLDIYSAAIEGKPLSSSLFRGCKLAGFENRSDETAARFQAFLERGTSSFEGNNKTIAAWLLKNAQRLQDAGIQVTVELSDKNTPTGKYILRTTAYLPPELGEEKKFELRHQMELAKQALEKGDTELAYKLARPMIRFLEVNTLLQLSLPILDAETSRILQGTVANAYKEIQLGNGQKASEMLDSVFNFLLLRSTLKDSLPAGTIKLELAMQLQTHGDKALEFIKAGDYQNATTLTGLAMVRVEREKELAQLQSLLPALKKYKVVVGIEYLRMFRAQDADGTWRFSPEKFKEVTGVSYDDYKKGNVAGERGLGLVMAEKMRTAISYLNLSIRNLDSAMKEFAEGKDGSQNFNESLQCYGKVRELAGAVNSMMSTVASRMQIAEHRAVVAKLDFSSGETKIEGTAARAELNGEKEKAQKILDGVSATLAVAFFQFAAGNSSEAVALSKRAQQQFKGFETQISYLNNLFFYAKSFEQTLGVMGNEADTMLRSILLTLDDAAYELFEMEKTEPAKDVSERLKRIQKLIESKKELNDPVKEMLVGLLVSLSHTASDLSDAKEQLARMRAKLLESYLPSQITMRSSAKLEDQVSFVNDPKMQTVWRAYAGLWEKSVGQAHALVSEIPTSLVQTYDVVREMQASVRKQEVEVERQLEQIRKRKIAAVAIGITVGVVVTAATLGVGTGAGVAAGTGTTTALLGTIAVTTLAVGGGALAGYGAGATYFQWKVAEDQGAPKEEVEKYRMQFYYLLGLSGLMAVAGVAGAGVRAVQAGTAARWVGGIGLTAFRVADYTALGALTLDGLYTTYQFVKEGNTGMALVTGAMTLVPFAVHAVIKLAGPKRPVFVPEKTAPKIEAEGKLGVAAAEPKVEVAPALPELNATKLTERYAGLAEPQTGLDREMLGLIDREATAAGVGREVAVPSVVGTLADDAERMAQAAKQGKPFESAYDGFAHNVAQKRAAELGRPVTAEDYLYGAIMGYTLKRGVMTNPGGFAYQQIINGAEHIAARTATEELPKAMAAYMKTIEEIAPRFLPTSGDATVLDYKVIGEVFDFAAFLHTSGVKDPLLFLTNASKSGLLDLFPITDIGSYKTLSKALTGLSDGIAKKIPPEKLPTTAEPCLTWIFDDLKRLAPEARKDYVLSVARTFEWSAQLGERLEKPLGKTKLPFLAYTMKDPTGILLKSLDNDVVRSELRDRKVFGEMSELLRALSIADMEMEPSKSWVNLVKKCFEYAGAPSAGETLKEARKFLVREKIPYLRELWELTVTDRVMKLEDAMKAFQMLAGKQTSAEFTEALGTIVYEQFGKTVGIPEEFARANLGLELALFRYHQRLKGFAKVADRVTTVFPDYIGDPEALKAAPAVLEDAYRARAAGPKAFQKFKFSDDFRQELKGFAGAEKGDAVFEGWRGDASTQVTVGDKRYTIRETGSFEDGLYAGSVKGATTCQDPRNMHVSVAGVVGTIELPWVKQVVVSLGDSPELIFRRRVFLMKGHDGRVVMAVQPQYHGEGLANVETINEEVMRLLKAKYEPLGIDVRFMESAAASDQGLNSGYGTFGSGRSPFFYPDSNGHEGRIVMPGGKTVPVRNGLRSRKPGEQVDFPIGWSSEGFERPYGQ